MWTSLKHENQKHKSRLQIFGIFLSQISVNKVLDMWSYTNHGVTQNVTISGIIGVPWSEKVLRRETTNWNKQGWRYPPGNKMALLLYTLLKVSYKCCGFSSQHLSSDCECKDSGSPLLNYIIHIPLLQWVTDPYRLHKNGTHIRHWTRKYLLEFRIGHTNTGGFAKLSFILANLSSTHY